MTSRRFELNEAKARDWLARNMAEFDAQEAEKDGGSEGIGIGSNYDPMSEGADTFNLVAAARDDEIITGPGDVDFNLLESTEETGYEWLLYVGERPEQVKLASYYAKIQALGDRTASPGAEAALAVLRQAVNAGNVLLSELDRYIATSHS